MLWSRAAPATSAATPSRRCARGHDVVVYDNLSAGHRAAARARGARRGRHPRRPARLRERSARIGVDAVMHFAAWLSVGESVTIPSATTATTWSARCRCSRRWSGAGCRFVFSSTCAVFGEPVETPITEDHPQRPINAYGETKLAIERALPHYERAYGIAVDRAALLQRRRRRSRRRARRGPRPRDAPDPAGDRRGARAADRSRSSATTTRRPTARACATTSTSPTWPPRTCWRSRRCGGARRRRLQPRQRPADVGARRHRRGRAGHGASVPHTIGARGATAIRRCCSRRATGSSASWAGAAARGPRRRSSRPPGAGASASARLSREERA